MLTGFLALAGDIEHYFYQVIVQSFVLEANGTFLLELLR